MGKKDLHQSYFFHAMFYNHFSHIITISQLHLSSAKKDFIFYIFLSAVTILCLTPRTTVMSARIPDIDACHRARNLCIFSSVQKEHRDWRIRDVLQRVSLCALSDVTVVLGMRPSIGLPAKVFSNCHHFLYCDSNIDNGNHNNDIYVIQ